MKSLPLVLTALFECNLNAEEAVCKEVKFNTAVSGKALRGHQLETYKVGEEDVCQLRCVAHNLCSSYNLGPRNNGWHDCEISKSDAIRHPNDLETFSGYIYRKTINPCSKSLCQENQTCVPLFGGSKYECLCPKGWTGDGCFQDIDECDSTSGTYNCDYHASCTNAAGSFQCACKQGFTGDGKLCIDFNECEPNYGQRDCDANAICENTAGSFNCSCKKGFFGNGKQCTGYITRIDIVSNGNIDPVKVAGLCSIKINGVEHCPKRRGHNIVARMLNGTITSGYFDTHGDRNAGKNLAAWINALPFDTVVLVVVADSAHRYYMDATAALKSVGAVDPLMSGYRSSWYLVGFKGAAKSWIRQGTAEMGKGPSKATVENIHYSN